MYFTCRQELKVPYPTTDDSIKYIQSISITKPGEWWVQANISDNNDLWVVLEHGAWNSF